MSRTYPRTFYNYLTLFGVGLVAFAVAAIVIFYVLDVYVAKGTNPYLGIFVLVVFPAVLVFGLLLIPLGALRKRRKLARGESTQPLIVDLANPGHRRTLLTFVIGTSIFLLVSTVGLYTTYEFTESVTFCGEVCHVMDPELIAFRDSPHAETHCVDCHVGSGADAYVVSKINGSRQLWELMRGTYSRPIPVPVHPPMRSADQICQDCHWPGKDYGSSIRSFDHYLGNATNDPWTLTMIFNIGGTSEGERHEADGIHWHNDADARMEFVAGDEQLQEIVELTWWRDGEPVVYRVPGRELSDAERAEAVEHGQARTMDCMDCHNRPAHRYKSPMEAVNQALAQGTLDRSVPWIKRNAVSALASRFETSGGATDSLGQRFTASLATNQATASAQDQATLLKLHRRNLFPDMNARWSDYPDNSGHLFHPGCMRCHGSDLQTETGETISAECETCHRVVAQGPPGAVEHWTAPAGLEFQHPIPIGDAERVLRCYECHIGDESVYLDPDGRRMGKPD